MFLMLKLFISLLILHIILKLSKKISFNESFFSQSQSLMVLFCFIFWFSISFILLWSDSLIFESFLIKIFHFNLKIYHSFLIGLSNFWFSFQHCNILSESSTFYPIAADVIFQIVCQKVFL
jgi:hypothetical protein